MTSEFERSAQREAVTAVERRWKRKHDAERRQRLRKQLCNLLDSFKGRKCVQWRDAPATIKPKTAVAGVRYLVLCEERGDKRLYELVSDGRGSMTAKVLSPLTEPIGIEMKDFKVAVSGKPYFILCNDVLYAV